MGNKMTIEEARTALKEAEAREEAASTEYSAAREFANKAKADLNEAIATFKVGDIVVYRGGRMRVKAFTSKGAIYAPFKKNGEESLRTVEEWRWDWTDKPFTAVKEETV